MSQLIKISKKKLHFLIIIFQQVEILNQSILFGETLNIHVIFK